MSQMKRVGRRIPGVNIGSPESRFAGGVPLGDQVAEVVRQVEAQAQQITPRQQGHVPVVAPIHSPIQGWGTFCLRCTQEAGEFVTVCAVDDTDWPPVLLVAAEPSPSEV